MSILTWRTGTCAPGPCPRSVWTLHERSSRTHLDNEPGTVICLVFNDYLSRLIAGETFDPAGSSPIALCDKQWLAFIASDARSIWR